MLLPPRARCCWLRMPAPALILPLYSQTTGSSCNWGAHALSKQRGSPPHLPDGNSPPWRTLFVKCKCGGGEKCVLGFPWTRLATGTCFAHGSPQLFCNFSSEGENLSAVFPCVTWIARWAARVLTKALGPY